MQYLRAPDLQEIPGLPHKPGRQYLSQASAQAAMADGRLLIGTRDGLLALKDGDRLFSLGAPAPNGPVHALSATPDGETVYGVCGDELDMCSLFRFSLKDGLQELGYFGTGAGSVHVEALSFCTYVRTCAISPDGRYLAVGADERLGTVLIYSLEHL